MAGTQRPGRQDKWARYFIHWFNKYLFLVLRNTVRPIEDFTELQIYWVLKNTQHLSIGKEHNIKGSSSKPVSHLGRWMISHIHLPAKMWNPYNNPITLLLLLNFANEKHWSSESFKTSFHRWRDAGKVQFTFYPPKPVLPSLCIELAPKFSAYDGIRNT